jgi:dTDP-4-amino-4,6-dideoxygalactose transaminase
LKVPLESFPVARAYQSQILSLPLFPEMTTEEQDYVAAVLKEIFH